MLFKYLSDTSYSLNSIANDEFFFSNREQFNDPIDCNPPVILPDAQQYCDKYQELVFNLKNIDEDLRTLLSNDRVMRANFSLLSDKKRILEGLRYQADNTGILCLSKKHNDPLMWSHYSGGHSGFCLGLDIPFINKYLWEDYRISDQALGMLRQVDYSNEPLDFSKLYFTLVGLMFEKSRNDKGFIEYDSGFDVFEKRKMANIMFHHFNIFNLSHKYSSWSYEEEVRLIIPPAGDGNESRKLIKFKPNVIQKVYFGFKMLDSSKTTVRRILETSSHPIEYYQALYNKDKVGLIFERLN
ncbi:DUF2971 domain-containing protein [Alteromonas australica]|uniref:DUF2971 domain-containing protein n=1 Tax=Alteromonas australica TaxID=589873 RepID=UPI0035C861B4